METATPETTTENVTPVTGTPETFEDKNWGVFLKNGASEPTLLGTTKGKGGARKFVSSYLETNPSIDRDAIVARPLGKPVHVRLKQIPTF